ncbi:MAG: hypothetical protein ACLGG1_07545 [Gammaproteobacteria bacterium]
MAGYGEAFRNRAVARLLPPESANAGAVAKEIGVSVQTWGRRRDEAQSGPPRGRAKAPIGAVTLNPERDSIIKTHLAGQDIRVVAA